MTDIPYDMIYALTQFIQTKVVGWRVFLLVYKYTDDGHGECKAAVSEEDRQLLIEALEHQIAILKQENRKNDQYVN